MRPTSGVLLAATMVVVGATGIGAKPPEGAPVAVVHGGGGPRGPTKPRETLTMPLGGGDRRRHTAVVAGERREG